MFFFGGGGHQEREKACFSLNKQQLAKKKSFGNIDI